MSKTVLANVETLFDPPVDVDVVDGADAAEAIHASFTTLDEFIDREINARMTKNVTWKNLESCFKWARVQEYLSDLEICRDDPVVLRLRNMLKSNQLINVQYNQKTRKIIKLNTDNM
jgi:hypothetical protein